MKNLGKIGGRRCVAYESNVEVAAIVGGRYFTMCGESSRVGQLQKCWNTAVVLNLRETTTSINLTQFVAFLAARACVEVTLSEGGRGDLHTWEKIET